MDLDLSKEIYLLLYGKPKTHIEWADSFNIINKIRFLIKNKMPHIMKGNFSKDELSKMASEMIYQMTGEKINEKEQCEAQGNEKYQIAFYYLNKVNKR